MFIKFIFLNILYYKTCVDIAYFVLYDLNLKESDAVTLPNTNVRGHF